MTNEVLTGSGFYRDSNCFANRRLTLEAERQGLLPAESTPFTRRGTRVHAGEAQTRDEQDAYEQTSARLEAEMRKHITDKQHTIREVEHRLYLRDGFAPIFSGQPDCFMVAGNIGVVGDLKPGFEADWEAWEYQINSYAILLGESYPVVQKVIGIVQTRFHGYRTWEYTFDQLLNWKTKIFEVVRAYQQVPDPANPSEPVAGPWCRYCKARLICKASLALAETHNGALVESLPIGPQGAAIIDKLKLVIKIAKDRLSWYQDRLADDPECIPGWELRTRKMPEIANVKETWQLLKTILPEENILKAAILSAPKLRSELRDIHPHLKEMEAKAAIDQLLGELIHYKESEKFLQKK